MSNAVYTEKFETTKQPHYYGRLHVSKFDGKIETNTELNKKENAIAFAEDIKYNFLADFEKPTDTMCHVPTFMVIDDTVYVSYYASTSCGVEDPRYHVARLAYCNINEPRNMTYVDLQAASGECYGKRVHCLYDTILMRNPAEPDYIYVMWTADLGEGYCRLYRKFNIKTKELGEICFNRFKVGDIITDFISKHVRSALTENSIGIKEFFSDIGIMQKQSWREENGKMYCYTGAYSGNFTCIIKSDDLVTWEYVAQPNEGANNTGFENETRWENAVYVLEDKVYYFVRQWMPNYGGSEYAILTSYDLNTKEWATPVLVGDSQSRSDFILYDGELYLFHAPTDRNHIGILKIDRDNLANSSIVLQANMRGSCFYPFIQYFKGTTLGMAYTVDRTHIRLATFDLKKYL